MEGFCTPLLAIDDVVELVKLDGGNLGGGHIGQFHFNRGLPREMGVGERIAGEWRRKGSARLDSEPSIAFICLPLPEVHLGLVDAGA